MSRGKLSRFATLIGVAMVATLTCAVVARASGFFIFVSAPSAFSFSYSLGPGGVTGCIFPPVGIPVQVIGVDTTLGDRGVGEVSMLHVTSGFAFLEWVGLDSPSAAAITSGFDGPVGGKIVFLDFVHTNQIEVCSADTFRVHNKSGTTHTGVVDVWF